LQAAIEDEAKADRACAILALVGAVNVPIVHFSVTWWNSLHQGETLFTSKGSLAAAVYLWPWGLMTFGYICLFGSLWLVRTRSEIWRRRARALALRAAG
jgi:heme exporter protein C